MPSRCRSLCLFQARCWEGISALLVPAACVALDISVLEAESNAIPSFEPFLIYQDNSAIRFDWTYAPYVALFRRMAARSLGLI